MYGALWGSIGLNFSQRFLAKRQVQMVDDDHVHCEKMPRITPRSMTSHFSEQNPFDHMAQKNNEALLSPIHMA
jgi:hypothetical protein